jgi:AmmeMemoRadiSam system protein A
VPAAAPLSEVARRVLLRTARAAIEAHLAQRPFDPPGEPAEVCRKRGAFVTLRRRAGGELRGCIGLIEPSRPLVEAVAHVAVSAASSDSRFAAVTPAELAGLAVEVSALGPLAPIRPEAVEVGSHGLMIRRDWSSGLLLPQVAIEHAWDRETFLAMTCRKAGLPTDAWTHADAELLAFTAEVFGEP